MDPLFGRKVHIGLFKVHVNSSSVTKTLRPDLKDFVRQMIVAVFTQKQNLTYGNRRVCVPVFTARGQSNERQHNSAVTRGSIYFTFKYTTGILKLEKYTPMYFESCILFKTSVRTIRRKYFKYNSHKYFVIFNTILKVLVATPVAQNTKSG